MQAVFGLLLCDLSYEDTFQDFVERHTIGRKILAAALVFSGLFIASYPGNNPEWASWSSNMLDAAQYIFPPDVDIPRRYTALGLDLIILAIYISPTTQWLLSKSFFTWLGRQGFAVYLLHGTLLRTVLVWAFYGMSGEAWSGPILDPNGKQIYDENGEPMHPRWIALRPSWVKAVSVPLWLGLLYLCGWAWTRYVDAFFGMITRKLEMFAFESDESDIDVMTPAIQLQTMPVSS